MKKLLAVLFVALMATPAFAAVQNVKVSGDIDSTFVSRHNFDLGSTEGMANALADQNVFLTQTRLRIDSDLSDNVSATIGLINERVWNAETSDALTSTSTSSGGITTTTTTTTPTNSMNTNVQLDLAYVTLREMLYSPLTVTIGRQTFAYGNGLVFDATGTNNTATGSLSVAAADLTKRTSLDAIRAVLDYKPLTVDLFYGKASAGVFTGAIDSGDSDDIDVFGTNFNYQLGDAMNTVVEAYFFARQDNSGHVNLATADKLYVPGLRVSTNPIKGLSTSAELAWQGGAKADTSTGTNTTGGDNIRRNAMAAQVMAAYELPVLEKYKPVASASYTYVSGDQNPNDTRSTVGTGYTQASHEVYTAWDPFMENQGGGTIYNTLLDLTNLHIVSVGLQASPLEDVTAKFLWTGLWLDRETENTALHGQMSYLLRQPDRTAQIAPVTKVGESQVGNEYDVNFDYAYTEDVKFGLNLGWFVPGDLFNYQNDSVATQAIAHVAVAF